MSKIIHAYNLSSLNHRQIQDVREKVTTIFEHLFMIMIMIYIQSPNSLFCERVVIIPILQMEKSRLSQVKQPFTLPNKKHNWDVNIICQACQLVLLLLPYFRELARALNCCNPIVLTIFSLRMLFLVAVLLGNGGHLRGLQHFPVLFLLQEKATTITNPRRPYSLKKIYLP